MFLCVTAVVSLLLCHSRVSLPCVTAMSLALLPFSPGVCHCHVSAFSLFSNFAVFISVAVFATIQVIHLSFSTTPLPFLSPSLPSICTLPHCVYPIVYVSFPYSPPPSPVPTPFSHPQSAYFVNRRFITFSSAL